MSAADQSEIRGERNRRLPWSDGPLLRDLRVPFAMPIVIVVGLVAATLILHLTRRFDFYFDEWDYVLQVRNWTVGQYFVPHNEHWETIPAVTYRLLIAIFGTRSYLPYMAVLMAWTIVLAVFLFLLVRRRSGDVPALAAACLMLVLGRGWENLLWADQIGFVGSSALGLLAILLITGNDVPAWRGWLGSLSLLAALMSTGPALFFLSWLLFDLIFDRPRRRRLMYLIGPILAYLTWFVIVGHTAIDSFQNPLSLTTLEQLGPFVASGIGGSAVTVIGLSPQCAMIGAIVFGLVIGAAWTKRRPDWVVTGAGIGLVAEFVLIGSVRSQAGVTDADVPRYMYIGAVFVLVILADIVGRLRWRTPLTGAVVALFLIGAILNGLYIPVAVRTRYTGSILPGQVSQQVAWAFRNSPGLDRPTSVDPAWMPTAPVSSYLMSRQLQGSPLPDVTTASLQRYPGSLVDRALDHLLPPHVHLVRVTSPYACREQGPGVTSIDSGGLIYVHTNEPGRVLVYLWHYGSRPSSPAVIKTIRTRNQALVVMPARAQPGFVWRIAVSGPPAASITSCVVS